MISKIKNIKPEKDYMLKVVFHDGNQCIYDVKEDMKNIPQYRALKKMGCLLKFSSIQAERVCSGTII